MLVPDKDPRIIAADKLLAEAGEAARAANYERVAALVALAQAHIAISRLEAEVEAATDANGHLAAISVALTEQVPA
jgi:hypothetical protein